MEFADLSRIAGIVAARVAVSSQRDDVYQSAMERFERYVPRTYRGAWMMAYSARNDIWRRERKQMKVKRELPMGQSTNLEDVIGPRATLQEMARVLPRQFFYVLRYIQENRPHSRAERTMVCRYRQQLKAAVGVG